MGNLRLIAVTMVKELAFDCSCMHNAALFYCHGKSGYMRLLLTRSMIRLLLFTADMISKNWKPVLFIFIKQ